jgi:hypothetical protein
MPKQPPRPVPRVITVGDLRFEGDIVLVYGYYKIRLQVFDRVAEDAAIIGGTALPEARERALKLYTIIEEQTEWNDLLIFLVQLQARRLKAAREQ